MSEQSKGLSACLQAHFDLNGARVKLVASFIIALLSVTTVNLSRLANGLNGSVKSASNYRRLQRFFKGIELDQALVARFVLSFLPPDDKLLVSMDRTNWQLASYTTKSFKVSEYKVL